MIRNCKTCGKPFESINNTKYCSNACRGYASEKPRVEKVCGYCGKKFISDRSGLRKYCSLDCSRLEHQRRTSARFKERYQSGELKEYMKNRNKKIKEDRIRKAIAKANAPMSELARINAEARARGLSYGQYVAQGIKLTDRG